MRPTAMILCAGLGTRLRPLTEELPKPLVPVGDRPLLGHIAGFLRQAGLGTAVINTHHLHTKYNNKIQYLEIEIEVVHEPRILGTAGGVAGARQLFGPPPIVVWNGDILCDPPLAALRESAGDGLCLAVAPRPRGEGSVGLDARGDVVRLRGETFGEEHAGGDYIGVAALGARCLAELPGEGCLVGDWALPELRRGGRVGSVPHTKEWSDLGDVRAYLEANLRFAGYLGEGAIVDAGVELSSSVVGEGARVSGAGRVHRCVIWPGAQATAPLENTIVTTEGRVVRVSG